MHTTPWVGLYRIIFFPALAVAIVIQLAFIAGLDPRPWLFRIETAAALLAFASATAIVISLAVRAYDRLDDVALRESPTPRP